MLEQSSISHGKSSGRQYKYKDRYFDRIRTIKAAINQAIMILDYEFIITGVESLLLLCDG